MFSRGSCTCSNLNPQSGALLGQFCDYIEQEDYSTIRKTQSTRLKELLNFKGQDAFDVVFAPSGSDLAYLPSIISEILQPGKEQLVLLTCPEELGSGSQMAFLGKYFGDKNQFGEPVEKGEDINPHYNISLSRFTARTKEGHIIDHASNIKQEIDKHPKMAKIGALVIGSKSGIEDDISLIPKIDNNVMWVVDLCQFRNSKKLVNELLDMNCMVMITGSKFYMAPPFCGVMLIPKAYARLVQRCTVDPELVKGFDRIFSYYDFPEAYENLRKFFPKKENPGLTLRWEIAIDEMERFNAIPVDEVNSLLYRWNDIVNEEIKASKHFELMPHQDQTNSTIISFKVRHPDGGYLEYDELRKFFKFVVEQDHHCFDRFHKVFFGQPVRYGHGAFIRLALGSNNIFNLLKRSKDERFKNDRILVDLLDRKVIEFVNRGHS
ncbi:hypothetical protein [Portibacter marinus]|uniref:hypothetical protein n=1 Tax=Portibacter marinus TaxID=2898660 RepID=UPI001F31F5BA|nr:hypothetical protein [Portibacter marinus]